LIISVVTWSQSDFSAVPPASMVVIEFAVRAAYPASQQQILLPATVVVVELIVTNDDHEYL